jgi:hypothetical protein
VLAAGGHCPEKSSLFDPLALPHSNGARLSLTGRVFEIKPERIVLFKVNPVVAERLNYLKH